MTKWRCKKCKSTDVEGSLPAWFDANDRIDLGAVREIDAEAQFEDGCCRKCGEVGTFELIMEEEPPSPSKVIFDKVVNAMQAADEMEGPEGQEYLDLMTKIEKEAARRREIYKPVKVGLAQEEKERQEKGRQALPWWTVCAVVVGVGDRVIAHIQAESAEVARKRLYENYRNEDDITMEVVAAFPGKLEQAD